MSKLDISEEPPGELFEMKYVFYKCIVSRKKNDPKKEPSIMSIPIGHGSVSGGMPGYEEEFLCELCRQLQEIISYDITEKNWSMSKYAPSDRVGYLFEYADRIKVLVRDNYKEDSLLETIADKLGFSPGYINEICKKETGFVFKNLVTRIRLYIASGFIRHGSEPISEIAQIVGLSAGGLSNTYKKVYGISPTNDRKMYASWIRSKQGGKYG